jgi:hypothetical protein
MVRPNARGVPMRILLLAAALALSACAPANTPEQSASACERIATHDATWSNETSHDTVTTSRSDGPTCAQAVVTFVARNSANGDPLWTFASTYYDMTMGGIPPDGRASGHKRTDGYIPRLVGRMLR